MKHSRLHSLRKPFAEALWPEFIVSVWGIFIDQVAHVFESAKGGC